MAAPTNWSPQASVSTNWSNQASVSTNWSNQAINATNWAIDNGYAFQGDILQQDGVSHILLQDNSSKLQLE